MANPSNKRNVEDFAVAMRALEAEVGHIPSYTEWIKRYGYSFRGLTTRLGGFRKARQLVYPDATPHQLPKPPTKRDRFGRHHRDFTDEQLLQMVRDFYERHGRVPGVRDFNNSPELMSDYIYRKRFGTMNSTRAKAGIPIVVVGGDYPSRVQIMPAAHYQRFKKIKNNQAGLRFKALQRKKRNKV